ncbi:hypothetical protein ACLOJK_038570 [Asimina triloba]
MHVGTTQTKVLHLLHSVVQGSKSRLTSSSQAGVDDGEIQQPSATSVIGSDHDPASVRRRRPQIFIGRRLQISYEAQAWQKSGRSSSASEHHRRSKAASSSI